MDSVITGDDGDNIIITDGGRDEIRGGDGDDTIHAGGNEDRIYGWSTYFWSQTAMSVTGIMSIPGLVTMSYTL